MIELKTCPFCGEEVELKEWYDYDTEKITGYSIFNSKRYNDVSKELCYGCSMEDLSFSSKEETIKAWNKRENT